MNWLTKDAHANGRNEQKGVLQQWDADRGKLTRIVEAQESLSALAVRDDGRFVAVGTMFTGSVSIYVAFSLQVSELSTNGVYGNLSISYLSSL